MKHDLFISLPWHHERDTSPLENDDKFPESLARYFLQKYTQKGSKVFDPFAGLGTTLFTAEETGRIPYGIEADRQRYEWVAGQLTHWQNLKYGDSAKIPDFNFPKMDFCLTSPPYMPRHHKWNPLFAGDPSKAGYDVYLKRMSFIFSKLQKIMKRNSYVIVQADNLVHGKIHTPLVFDFAQQISKSFTLETEIIVTWENPKPDYSHTHCLVFKNT